jgi:hypothetical protein
LRYPIGTGLTELTNKAGTVRATRAKARKERPAMLKKKMSDARMARSRVLYMLELARGSSHISSTRSPDTLNVAISEVLNEFVDLYGADELEIFQELLALEIEQRGNSNAAQSVRYYRHT